MLRTRNSYLSVIGVVSPMIGLLGTVIGMMGAFAVLASAGMSDPRLLSGKISEVLLATASGLFNQSLKAIQITVLLKQHWLKLNSSNFNFRHSEILCPSRADQPDAQARKYCTSSGQA